jgi:site-specific DNA recombinase
MILPSESREAFPMSAPPILRAALYGRYSTDKQSENSIADQFRVCEGIAGHHGFQVVGQFSDAALSGGTTQREGYQALLAAARRGELDVIVAEDASRLWRLMAEQSPRLAELLDLGVHVVTQDLDTRLESAGILGAVNGAMSEHYRQEIARRTRRGLEGRARAKKPTGGRAYGYVAARDSGTVGERTIHPEQAEIVRRVFEYYADGTSPRAIAAALNREGVPSPGSTWKRNERRQLGWMASAIAGDMRRGVGVLNNEMYIGTVIWNRFKWVRSASDSSRRRCVENPKNEWIVHTDESLRIVPQTLWDRVKARQKARSEAVGDRVRKGYQAALRNHAGRKPKFLFSGLLRCGTCGARLVIADRTHYACSSRVNGGEAACASDVRIKRTLVESGLLRGIKSELLTPEIIADIGRETRQSLRGKTRVTPAPDPKRLASVEEEIRNLVDAIANGALRASPAMAERLAQAEAELASLKVAAHPVKTVDIERLVGRVMDRYRTMVEALERSLPEADIEQARADLRALFGSVKVVADEQEIRFEADPRATQLALLRAAGGSANNVVAGAGFEPATFGL